MWGTDLEGLVGGTLNIRPSLVHENKKTAYLVENNMSSSVPKKSLHSQETCTMGHFLPILIEVW